MGDPITTGLLIGGTVLSGVGSYSQGAAAQKQANAEAAQLTAQASNQKAASQLQAMEDRRQARLLESRAQAVAAASGGGATDTSVVNAISGLEEQGELNALTTLFSGNQQSQQLLQQAASRRAEGSATKKAGGLRAFTSLLSAGGSLYDRYGGSPTQAKTTTQDIIPKKFKG